MIKLTTPEGAVYIRKEAIVAVATTEKEGINDTVVRSRVFVAGQHDGFNILEEAETVYGMLAKRENTAEHEKTESKRVKPYDNGQADCVPEDY